MNDRGTASTPSTAGDTAVFGVPARLVMSRALDVQGDGPKLSFIARLLGRSPLLGEASSWYQGAVGERAVARELRRLPQGWRCLHSIPVGSGSSDVDHVVIGPGGVFVLNAKHHAGKIVYVQDDTVRVSGVATRYVPAAQEEARKVASALSTSLPRGVRVLPLIVVVGAAKLTIRRQPARVRVVSLGELRTWLRRRPKVLDAATVSQLVEVAAHPSNWRPANATQSAEITDAARPLDTAGIAALGDPTPRFEALEREVRTAGRIRRWWAYGLTLACGGVLLGGFPWISRELMMLLLHV